MGGGSLKKILSLIFWGQIKIASGLASILNATTPLWTVMLAHFLTRDEKLNPGRFSGVILGIIGVIIIIGPEVLKGFGANALAQLAVVGAAASYAFAGIFGKQFKSISPYVMATGQLTCSGLLMIPVSLWVDGPWTLALPDANIWACLITLTLVCTALAYILYFKILSSAGATNLMLVTFLIPVSALLLGILVLGERLDLRHFLDMATIALGLIAIDGRFKQLISDKLIKLSMRSNTGRA
jgi:drug/metabolite transporter (DMT)-like permease